MELTERQQQVYDLRQEVERLRLAFAEKFEGFEATSVVVPIQLFHRTTVASAWRILDEGFRDSTWSYLTRNEYTGLWLSNVPLDVNEGAEGDVLFEVKLYAAVEELAQWEWVEREKPYREFLAPADWVNPRSTLCVVDEDAE